MHLIIQAFAVSMISVFVPIYLLTIGFSLAQVVTFLLIEWTLFGLLSPLYAKLIHKIGLREAILIRTPFLILAYLLLFLLESNTTVRAFYWIIPIIGGISGSIYALSITSLFAESLGNKNHGEKTAKLISYPQIISAAGPFIGGFLASLISFPFVIGLVVVFLIISIIPIGLIKEKITHPKFNINVFKDIKVEFKEFLMLNSYGVKSMIFFVVLPLSIYFFSTDILVVGAVISTIALARAGFTMFLGKYCDKHGHKTVIRIGAILTSIILLLLGFFSQSPFLYVLAIISGFTNIMTTLVYETHLYDKARKHPNPLEFLTFKEFSLFWGRLIIFAAMLIYLPNFEVSYFIGAVTTLFFFFL